MAKSKEAFRTISEVADWLETQTHVLRFWESKFSQVRPVKRAGGRRYYRPNDMLLLGGIKKLLHEDGMTIKGVQKLLREHGVKHVTALSRPLDDGLEAEEAVTVAEDMAVEQPLAAEAESPPPAAEPTEAESRSVDDDDAALQALRDSVRTAQEIAADTVEAEEDESAAEDETHPIPDLAMDEPGATPQIPGKDESRALDMRRALMNRLTRIEAIPAAHRSEVSELLASLKSIRARRQETLARR